MVPFPADPREQRELLDAVTVVATDVDGTLTTSGVLSAPVIEAIAALGDARIEVLPVSGRAAGEVLGLVRYLPGVRRGIAENGQVLVEPDRPLTWLTTQPDRGLIEASAREIGRGLSEPLTLAPDWFCRVGDVAFERAGRGDSSIAPLVERAAARGLHVVWSSVHIHFSATAPDKGAALARVLDRSGVPRTAVLTMGDAPNDAGLFVEDRFGVTVGTHDVRAHAAFMTSVPRYLCAEREGAAFLSVARALLRIREA